MEETQNTTARRPPSFYTFLADHETAHKEAIAEEEDDLSSVYMLVYDCRQKIYVGYKPNSKDWHLIQFYHSADFLSYRLNNFTIVDQLATMLSSHGGLTLWGTRKDEFHFTVCGGRKLSDVFLVVNPLTGSMRNIIRVPCAQELAMHIDFAGIFMIENGASYCVFLAERGVGCEWNCWIFNSTENTWGAAVRLRMKNPGVFRSCVRYEGQFYCLMSDNDRFLLYRVTVTAVCRSCEELVEERPSMVHPDRLISGQLFTSRGDLMLGGIHQRGRTVCLWKFLVEGEASDLLLDSQGYLTLKKIHWRRVYSLELRRHIPELNNVMIFNSLGEREVAGMGDFMTNGLELTLYSTGHYIFMNILRQVIFGADDDAMYTIKCNLQNETEEIRKHPKGLSGGKTFNYQVISCLYEPTYTPA